MLYIKQDRMPVSLGEGGKYMVVTVDLILLLYMMLIASVLSLVLVGTILIIMTIFDRFKYKRRSK